MADKKISELDLALLINNDAVFPMSQDNAGEPTTFKVGITQLGTEIAEDMTFSNLRTTSKKLVGAINELSHLGNPILFGTTAPTAQQGSNGNLYVQYTAGTGGASDTVDALFVKLDGAWCEISTGGGGGTTDYDDLSNKPQVNSIELVGNKSLDDLGIMPASLSKTVSGAIAHITDGADNVPVKSLVSEIVAVESGSGAKSPENPYTISGFDNGIITVTDNDQITNTYTFTFGQTVYGGHFDNKGNLVVTHKILNFDYQSNWRYENILGGNFYVACGSDVKASQFGDDLSCNCSPSSSILAVTSNTCLISVAKNFNFTWGGTLGITNVDDFKTYLQTNNLVIKVKCLLANPITLSITSQDIPTLLGENCFYSNTGELEVNYYTSKSNDILDLIKSVGTGGLQPVIYSEEEREIGVWVDGKPLYEKTIINSNPSYTQVGSIYECNTTVDFSGIDYFMIVNATALNANSTRPVNNTRTDITAMGYVSVGKSTNVIYTAFNTDGYTKLVFTLRYTKTTDQAGSGQWTPQGVPAHHYSEDEHVVGTWIDGSTVYERVFDLGSDINVPNTELVETSIDATNISKLIQVTGMYSTGATVYPLMANIGNNKIRLQSDRNGSGTGASVRYVILQYTKSST